MKSLLLFILFFLLSLNACKKKQYCLYRRHDLIGGYILLHPSKHTTLLYLQYDYSNPYNVYLADSSRRQLDSMINKEGYTIDTQQKLTGFSYKIEGNCQYCSFYHTISQEIFCEPSEE